MTTNNSQVDVHIIIAPNRNPKWIETCLSSLKTDIENNTAVIHHPSWHFNVDAARLEGLGMGTADYVTWVDDDDWIEPGYLTRAKEYLDLHPEVLAVYCSEDRIHDRHDHLMTIRTYPPLEEPWSLEKQIRIRPYVHHGVVFRRSAILPHLSRYNTKKWQLLDYFLVAQVSLDGPIAHLPEVGYYWRVHQDGHHNRPDAVNSVLSVYEDFISYLKTKGITLETPDL